MIVCIHEHFEGNGSYVYFVDTDKARDQFKRLILIEVAKPREERQGIQPPPDPEDDERVGSQRELDWPSIVKPPCLVDDVLEMWPP